MRKSWIYFSILLAGCAHTDLISTPNHIKESSKGLSYFLPVDKLAVNVSETITTKVTYEFDSTTNRFKAAAAQIDPKYTLTPSIVRRGDPAFSYNLYLDVGNSTDDDLTIITDDQNLLTSVTFESEGKSAETIKGIAGTAGSITSLVVAGALSDSDESKAFKQLTSDSNISSALSSIDMDLSRKAYLNTNIETKYAIQQSESVRVSWYSYLANLKQETGLESKISSEFSVFVDSSDEKKRKISKENYQLLNTRLSEQKKTTETAYSKFMTSVSEYLNTDSFSESTTTRIHKLEFHFDEIPATGAPPNELTGRMKALHVATDHYFTANISGLSMLEAFSPATNSILFKQQLEKDLANTTNNTVSPVDNDTELDIDAALTAIQSEEIQTENATQQQGQNTQQKSVKLHSMPEDCIDSSCVFYRNSIPVQLQLVKDQIVITNQSQEVIPRFMVPNYIENVTSVWSKKDLTLTFTQGELTKVHKISKASAEKIASAMAESTTSFINSAKTTASAYKDFLGNMNDIKTSDLALELKTLGLESQILGKEREIAAHEDTLELNDITNELAVLQKQNAIDLSESTLLKNQLANQTAALQSQRAIALHDLTMELDKIQKEKAILDKKYELDSASLTYEERLQLSALQAQASRVKAQRDAVNAGISYSATIINSIESREKALNTLLDAYKDNQSKTDELQKEIKMLIKLLESK